MIVNKAIRVLIEQSNSIDNKVLIVLLFLQDKILIDSCFIQVLTCHTIEWHNNYYSVLRKSFDNIYVPELNEIIIINVFYDPTTWMT